MNEFKKEISGYNLIIKYEIYALHTFLSTLKGQAHDHFNNKDVLLEEAYVFVDTKVVLLQNIGHPARQRDRCMIV
jgi:hypothetical protein